MDENGKEIPMKADENGKYSLEESPFYNGKPLIAQFSDGTSKTYFGSMDTKERGSYYKMDTERLATYGVKDTAANLMSSVKNADPMYLLSGSSQFKGMREAMEEMEKASKTLGAHPTEQQLVDLKRITQNLEKASKEYLDYKMQGKDPDFNGKNDREKSRIAIAKNIQNFANQQLKRLDRAFELDPMLEAEGNFQEKHETTQKFGSLDKLLFEKKHDFGLNSMTISSEAMEKLAQMVDQKYPKQPNDPESALNRLNGYIKAEIHDMAYNPDGGGFQRAAQHAEILMTGYDLIAQEKKNLGGEGCGPLETMFNENGTKFAQTVAKSSTMQEHLKDPISPRQFEQFLNNNGGRKLAAQVIQQAKAPAQRTNSSTQPQMSQQRQTQPKVNAPKK